MQTMDSPLPRGKGRSGLIVANRQTITTPAQPLIRGVVHRLADEMDAAIAEHKLATLRMPRAEAPSEVPVALGHAVRHAGDTVVRIPLVGGFLLAAGASGHQVDGGR